jgi:hypothetical protein
MKREKVLAIVCVFLATLAFVFSSFTTVEPSSPIIREMKAERVTNLTFPSYAAAKVEIEGKYFAVVYSDKGIAICPW